MSGSQATARNSDAAPLGPPRRIRIGKAWIDALRESQCVAHVLRELAATATCSVCATLYHRMPVGDATPTEARVTAHLPF